MSRYFVIQYLNPRLIEGVLFQVAEVNQKIDDENMNLPKFVDDKHIQILVEGEEGRDAFLHTLLRDLEIMLTMKRIKYQRAVSKQTNYSEIEDGSRNTNQKDS